MKLPERADLSVSCSPSWAPWSRSEGGASLSLVAKAGTNSPPSGLGTRLMGEHSWLGLAVVI